MKPLDELFNAPLRALIRLDRERCLDNPADEMVIVVGVDAVKPFSEGVDGERDMEHLLSLLVGALTTHHSRTLNGGHPVLEEARVEVDAVAGGNNHLQHG